MKSAPLGVGWITLLLYPFGAGAVAINLFMAGLIGPWFGLPVLSPERALWGGAVLGVPVTWLFARHIRALMDKADAGPESARTE